LRIRGGPLNFYKINKGETTPVKTKKTPEKKKKKGGVKKTTHGRNAFGFFWC